MARSIDYYFTSRSPWAYIGHAAVVATARRHGASIRYRPVDLDDVFPESGGLPLAKRHPLRQRYRMMELQRWRDRRGLALHLHPRFWPFDSSLADRTVLAVADAGADPDPLLGRIFAGVFERELDLSDRAVLFTLLREAVHDADRVLARADGEPCCAAYESTGPIALAAGVFGSPSYVLDGEVFWGQDRIELLDAALTSGRAPYRGDG